MNDIYLTYDYVVDDCNKPLVSNGIEKNYYFKLRDELGDNFKYMELYPEISDFNFFKQCEYGTQPTDSKYIYVLPYKNVHYFNNKFKNFKLTIPLKVKEDVDHNKALILIDYSNEGDLYSSSKFFEFLRLIEHLPVPKNKLFLTHCDLKTEEYIKYNFTYIPFSYYFTYPYFEQIKNSNIIPYVPSKLYVNYNNRIHGRFHRVLLLAYLNKENLLNDGIISIGDSSNIKLDHVSNTVSDLSEEHMEIFSSMCLTSPDLNNLSNNGDCGPSINHDHHINSFVSLVSETLCNSESIYFSEKIFKPIVLGHPFIVNGNPHSLSKLKEFGFKTFSKYWDESYDDEINLVKRIKKIVNIISDLNKLDDKHKKQIRSDMVNMLTHNKIKFFELRNDFKSNFLAVIDSLYK